MSKKLGSFSIQKKFIALQAIISLILIIGGLIIYQAVAPIKPLWHDYANNVVKREYLIQTIKGQFGYGGVIHNFKNYVLRRDTQKYLPRLDNSFNNLNQTINEYQSLPDITQEEIKELNQISQTIKSYQTATKTISQMVQAGNSSDAIDQVVKINDNPAFNAFTKLHEQNEQLHQKAIKQLNNQLVTTQTSLLWEAVLALLFINISIFVLSHFISKRIIIVNSGLQQVEQTKDLSIRLTVDGNDELTQLALSFNQLMDQLSSILVSTIRSAVSVSTQTTQQGGYIDSMVTNSRRQHDEIDMVATAMNEMTTTVLEVSQNTTQTAEAAHKANSEAIAGREVMYEMLGAMETLQQRIESAAQVITQLESSSEKISSVLEVINGISEQTNLLALNAAIEAARAGEQGRGFAVVADEVRGLAGRTQSSTNEIRTMIDDLRSKVQNAVQVMQLSQSDASNSSGQATKAGEALELIITEITTINDMATQIATAAEEQTHVAEEMNRNILNINTIADNGQQKANETLYSTAKIVEAVEELRNNTSIFTVSDVTITLEQAKVAHLSWRGKLRAFLNGKGNLKQEQAVSHHHCALGKWYYDEGLAQFSHITEMKQIEAPHAELHSLIKQIITLKEKGDNQAAELAYEKITPLSANIVELLDKVQDKIMNA